MSNRLRMVGLGFAVVVGFLPSGCASVPMAPTPADTEGKTFVVKPDKASIYLYRNETFGGAIAMTVTLDAKVAGRTAPQTYFLWEVDPGPHEVASHAENVETLKLDTVAGRAYYVWQEVKMGVWMARSRLQLMDEAAGRQGVSEYKRAQSAF